MFNRLQVNGFPRFPGGVSMAQIWTVNMTYPLHSHLQRVYLTHLVSEEQTLYHTGWKINVLLSFDHRVGNECLTSQTSQGGGVNVLLPKPHKVEDECLTSQTSQGGG